MDPFEVRMQFIALLKRLSASQQSIQKVVGFAVKYFSSCGEDIWECIIEDCEKGSINARINILYFLDSLCEACLLVKSQRHTPRGSSSSHGAEKNTTLYVDFVSRDLGKIVEYVVPKGRQGLPNLVSTKQILESWRSKRILDPQKVDEVISTLNDRTTITAPPPSDQPELPPPPSSTTTSSSATSALEPQKSSTSSTAKASTGATSSLPSLSRNEVFTRIEEDRERHKRLRERRWVQPISYASSSFFNPNTIPLASFLPLPSSPTTTSAGGGGGGGGAGSKATASATTGGGGGGDGEDETALDIEFENEWETTSDWNEDDVEVVTEESELCFPGEGEGPMDLS